MAVQPRNSPMNAEDEYCDDHGLFYEFSCPECSSAKVDRDANMSKTAKDRKGSKVCDYCEQPSYSVEKVTLPEGGTMSVCPHCVGAVAPAPAKKPPKPAAALVRIADTKSCGCVFDGDTPTYCPEHDRHYCPACTKGRNECPTCELYDQACEQKEAVTHCDCPGPQRDRLKRCGQHNVWYCGQCHPICPRCQVAAVEVHVREVKTLPPAKTAQPNNYPLVSCYSHGWYCSRCDKDCPGCNSRPKWEMPRCSHKSPYCPRCGMGCKTCGKRTPLAHNAKPPAPKKREHVMECPACRKHAYVYCESDKNTGRVHGYHCNECDGPCLHCNSFSKGGVRHHKCGRQMSHCLTHKKYFCLQCGQKCKLCVEQRQHRCGSAMAACKRHDKTYCPRCNEDCGDCKEEAAFAKKRQRHHCGCSMLYCAQHQINFCPACDYLCKCAIDCGVVERYGSKEDENRFSKLSDDLEWQWADFQTWLKERVAFTHEMNSFHDNWHDLVRFLFPKFLMSGGPVAEEAGEKLMAVDGCFKALHDLAVKLGAKPDELDADEEDDDGHDLDDQLDRAYGGYATYVDDDGKVHTFYSEPEPKYVRVTITDEGDDLSEGAKTVKFQTIKIETH